jgi:hypothetical protein
MFEIRRDKAHTQKDAQTDNPNAIPSVSASNTHHDNSQNFPVTLGAENRDYRPDVSCLVEE